MGAYINVVGRIGKDPEVKVTERGEFVTFSLASDEYSSEKKENQTAWWSCLSYNERISRLVKDGKLKKGYQIQVNGKLTLGTYVDKQGQTQIDRNINVFDFEYAGGGNGGQQQQQGNMGQPSYGGNAPQVVNVNEQMQAPMMNPQPGGMNPAVAATPRSQAQVAPQAIGGQPTQFAQPVYGQPQQGGYGYQQPAYGQPQQGGYGNAYPAPQGGDNDSQLPF